MKRSVALSVLGLTRGCLVLDNSDREEYAEAVMSARAAGWPERRFIGPVPFIRDFGQTTIWIR